VLPAGRNLPPESGCQAVGVAGAWPTTRKMALRHLQLRTSVGCRRALALNELSVKRCRAPTCTDQGLDGSFRLGCHLLGGPGTRRLDVQGRTSGPAAAQAPRADGGRGGWGGPGPTAVAAARARAGARSLRNVSFLEGDPTGMAFERPFDAVVGRYVLMFHPDPPAALRALARHLRPGGVMVFYESDWEGVRWICCINRWHHRM
jgi:SAM-dependent methyltransferase